MQNHKILESMTAGEGPLLHPVIETSTVGALNTRRDAALEQRLRAPVVAHIRNPGEHAGRETDSAAAQIDRQHDVVRAAARVAGRQRVVRIHPAMWTWPASSTPCFEAALG
jgi:hypothetical protein